MFSWERSKNGQESFLIILIALRTNFVCKRTDQKQHEIARETFYNDY